MSMRLAAKAPDSLTGALAAIVGALVALALWWNPGALATAGVCIVALLILRRPDWGVVAFALVVTLVPFGVVPLRVVFAPSFVDIVLTAVLAAVALRGLHQ